MRYFDSSFLTPLLLVEATSAAVQKFLGSLDSPDLVISQWTRVEVASALARAVRMGLPPQAANAAEVKFRQQVQRAFTILLPDEQDFEAAHRLLLDYRTALRSGDALHLAIAANRNVQAIYTLDADMLKAGKLLGLPVERGI